jgi:hypothetical protein
VGKKKKKITGWLRRFWCWFYEVIRSL